MSRRYVAINNGTVHAREIRQEIAEQFGIRRGDKVEGAFLLDVLRANYALERAHEDAKR